MLKIGDFSKLSQVTIEALRHYDTLGLLKPATVDTFTGYRYYAYGQLGRLNRILALKDLGFSLEQIARVLEGGVSAEQLRGMLRLKRAEIAQRIDAEQERLQRVEARLRQIEMETNMPNYEVVVKKVENLHVAAIRGIVPTYKDQGPVWGELYSMLGVHHTQFAGPCITVYYDEGYKEHDVDLEVCQPMRGAIPVAGRIIAHELPGATMACVIHHGPYTTIGEAYNALTRWVEGNGYRIAGAAREVNLQPPAQAGLQTDPNTLTEIQFPVEKA
jgi:effector-binding domain-containing protein